MAIVFFNRSAGIGGEENLILNLCIEISYNNYSSLKVICRKDGYLYNQLVQKKINFTFINIQKENFNSDITADDVVIKTDMGNLQWFKNCKAKFIYWEIFPTVLSSLFGLKRKLYFKQKLLDYLDKKNSLLFMDIHGAEELKTNNYQVNSPVFLPIPVKISVPYQKREINNQGIIITYVGRAIDWKIFPIKKVIDDIEKSGIQNVKVVIFTDNSKKYQEVIGHRNIEIEYFENVYGRELEDYLIENSVFHFAMGTSALEAAKLGIPVVLMDFSGKEFPETYKYIFLSQAKGFSLGNNVSKVKYRNDERKNLTEIRDIYLDKNKYEKISLDCFNYVYDKHNMDIILKQFLNSAEKTTSVIKKVYSVLLFAYYEFKLKNGLFKKNNKIELV